MNSKRTNFLRTCLEPINGCIKEPEMVGHITFFAVQSSSEFLCSRCQNVGRKALYHVEPTLKILTGSGYGRLLMEFCPNCGCFLAPQKMKLGDETVVVIACSKCGYKRERSDKATRLRSGRVVHRTAKPAVTVISEEDQKIQTMPTIKVECPKCGNNLVFVWQVQTRGGDEASTQFMRCTKCGHTFREYS